MGRAVAWESIPDQNVLASGVYEVVIDDVEERRSRSGLLMYTMILGPVAPIMGGPSHFENFVIGTQDDPNADDPQTWANSVGARILKRALRAAQVPLEDDLDAVLMTAAGQHVVIAVSVETETEGPYAGRQRNRISGWYSPGEREPALDGDTPTAPARTATKPTSSTPAPEPVNKVVRPPARSAPKSAPKPAVKAAVASTIECALCQPPQQVPRAQYATHVQQHDEE